VTSRVSSFVGIDLAWSPRNNSGVAALTSDGETLQVTESGLRRTDDEIVAFVDEHIAALTIIMVDAPLVVPNMVGMRHCDRLTHQHFGRYQAGAYPANRENMGRYNGGVPRGEALGLLLQKKLRCSWPPPDVRMVAGEVGRYVFEVYPHPAQVILFGLERSLKYKRKRQGIGVAREEFRRYIDLMAKLPSPRIAFEADLLHGLDVAHLHGRAYKEREDRLDALFCAYLAALVPLGRMTCLGEPCDGSIVLPADQVAAVRSIQ